MNLAKRDAITDEVLYRKTNECLAAIVAGLAIAPGDEVLAIGGSGDQVFALAEHAKKVMVVDSKEEQLDYIQLRINALKHGDIEFFFSISKRDLEPELALARRSYLSECGCLDRIASRVGRIEILPRSDITDAAQQLKGKFNKIYGSNAVQSQDKTMNLGATLPHDGLLYLARKERLAIDNFVFQDGGLLELEESLTLQACLLEKSHCGAGGYRWRPSVYQRTAADRVNPSKDVSEYAREQPILLA